MDLSLLFEVTGGTPGLVFGGQSLDDVKSFLTTQAQTLCEIDLADLLTRRGSTHTFGYLARVYASPTIVGFSRSFTSVFVEELLVQVTLVIDQQSSRVFYSQLKFKNFFRGTDTSFLGQLITSSGSEALSKHVNSGLSKFTIGPTLTIMQ